MRRFFGVIVGLGGLYLLAYGGVKYLTGASFDDMLAIAGSFSISVAQSIIFGFIALVLGAILTFAS